MWLYENASYLNILPYGIWNWCFLKLQRKIINLNILPYGIWNIGKTSNQASMGYLNILPYGIWNEIIVVDTPLSAAFEHSSLWDLKLGKYIVKCRGYRDLNILPYGIWNSCWVDSNRWATKIWTFFPMGFETCSNILVVATRLIWTFFPMGFEIYIETAPY